MSSGKAGDHPRAGGMIRVFYPIDDLLEILRRDYMYRTVKVRRTETRGVLVGVGTEDGGSLSLTFESANRQIETIHVRADRWVRYDHCIVLTAFAETGEENNITLDMN